MHIYCVLISVIGLGLSVLAESDVVVLTSENFNDVITQNEVGVVVEFYAPWCGHCKTLAPEYERAAAKLKEFGSKAVLANCDATVNGELAQKFGVSGYPTLKFFKGDPENAMDFDSGRTENEIVMKVKELTDPNYKPPPSEVVVLTTENFREFVDSNVISLVEFYAPWCGHCKKLTPEYEKAAIALKSEDIPLAKVDATAEPDLATEFGISGYPTLKIFRKGKVFDVKDSWRDESSIVSGMKTESSPSSLEVSSIRDMKVGISTNPQTILGIFDSSNSELYKLYVDSTQQERGEFPFFHTFDAKVSEAFKVKPGEQIVLFNSPNFLSKYEPKYKSIDSADSVDTITAFYKNSRIPLVGVFDSTSYEDKRPLIVIYYLVNFDEHKELTQYWRNKFVEVANVNKDITFAIGDEQENLQVLKSVALDTSSEDFNVVLFGEDGLKYPLNPDDEFSIEVLEEFIQQFKHGKLKPYFKSAKAPKKQTGPVVTVVANTFEKIVLDETKDVLIELYAPWCGHCKKLDPIYKEFAQSVKTDRSLIVAKMDATTNDQLPKFKASGFPTIFYVPKGSVEPITFEGDRTFEGFKLFIAKQRGDDLGEKLKDEL
jgi:protein disulfide-isomerase A4